MGSEVVSAMTDELQLRSLISSMADQLCPAVDGRFDFRVHVEAPDETIEKLEVLINFVLDAARRSVSKLQEQQQYLQQEIADRRLAQEQLRDSEQRLLLTLESVNAGIVTIDRETHTIIDANTAALRMIGAARDQVVGRLCHRYICFAEEGRCPITDLGQPIDNAERVLLTATGQSVPILKTTTPMRLGGRDVLLESFVDISRRKEAEELTLRQSTLLKAINAVFQQTLTCRTPLDVARVCIEEARSGTGSEFGFAGQVSDAGVLDILAFSSPTGETSRMTPSDTIALVKDKGSQGIWRTMLQERRSILLNDLDSCRDATELPAGHPGMRTVLCVPLKENGQVVGMVALANKAGGYTKADLDWVEALAVAFLEALNRKRAEVALRDSENKLVETATYQIAINGLQQRLLGPGKLRHKLDRITTIAVSLLGADFCRIWVTKAGDLCESGCIHAAVTEGPHVCKYRDRCLHLVSSSGRYTHVDGEVHRRVPFGCYKIGRVASGDDHKFLTNNATTDPRVHNHGWAKDLGLVAFAGYQLRRPGGETLGVLALFSQHAISPEIDAILESLACTAAQVIQNTRAAQEQQSLQAQLLQAQRLESVGRLAAGIAHEINTPTQFVSDNARFLQDAFPKLQGLLNQYRQLLDACRGGNTPPALLEQFESGLQQVKLDYLLEQIPEALSDSLEGLERVTKIVRAMKDFAHPGQQHPAPADLNKAIESTVTVARNEWKYVAEMKLDLDPTLPQVPCLLGDFNQVILNMVVNAAHAIGDVIGDGSHGLGTITIATRRDKDHVEIRVSDTGTGIPEEHRGRIFDHFFTTKEVGKGTGQGLSIALQVIVDKHRGTLTFETETGHGTTFVIRLPVLLDSPTATGQPGHDLSCAIG